MIRHSDRTNEIRPETLTNRQGALSAGVDFLQNHAQHHREATCPICDVVRGLVGALNHPEASPPTDPITPPAARGRGRRSKK